MDKIQLLIILISMVIGGVLGYGKGMYEGYLWGKEVRKEKEDVRKTEDRN